MLASGTVFNEVLLWNIRNKGQNGDGIVLQRLIGHEVVNTWISADSVVNVFL